MPTTIDRGKAAEILSKLPEQLSNEMLLEIFPGDKPEDIRALLKHLAAFFVPPLAARKTAAPAESTATKATGGLKLFTDGAARGNPGKAGAGILLLNSSNEELIAEGIYLGQCTNNVAEYKALIHGLTKAKEFSPARLDIFLDSELIVKQLRGEYRVKNEKLKSLYSKAVSLLGGLTSYSVRHVPRAENKRADELANAGIDENS